MRDIHQSSLDVSCERSVHVVVAMSDATIKEN
jgi:hypothetical protein